MDATIATFIRYFRARRELREPNATMGPETGFQAAYSVQPTSWSGFDYDIELGGGLRGFSLCHGGFVAKDDQKRKSQNDERGKPDV